MALNTFAKHIFTDFPKAGNHFFFFDKTGLLTLIAHDLTTETCINSNLSLWVQDLWHLLALGLKSPWCWGLYYLGGWCVYILPLSHTVVWRTLFNAFLVPPSLQARTRSRLIQSSLCLFCSLSLFCLPKVFGEQRDHCAAKRPVIVGHAMRERERGWVRERECVLNPLFSALSVSLLFTTLARAVPYDCFDGERRRAPISVSGCNYSLEGPHLAVGSRHTEAKRERKKRKDMKKQKMRQKRWSKRVKLKKYNWAKSLRRGKKNKTKM